MSSGPTKHCPAMACRRKMRHQASCGLSAEQVRPLLSGAAGCLVVVTSRNRLSGLVAVEGAHPITLHQLSGAEARLMLARGLGRARVAAERPAVDEIIDRCAGLPLALAVAASGAPPPRPAHRGARRPAARGRARARHVRRQ